jgi:hypothetical protein
MSIMTEPLVSLGFNSAPRAKSEWTVKPWVPGETGKLVSEVNDG